MQNKTNRNCWAVIHETFVDSDGLQSGAPDLYSSFKKAKVTFDREVNKYVSEGWHVEVERGGYYAEADICVDNKSPAIYKIHIALIAIK